MPVDRRVVELGQDCDAIVNETVNQVQLPERA